MSHFFFGRKECVNINYEQCAFLVFSILCQMTLIPEFPLWSYLA